MNKKLGILLLLLSLVLTIRAQKPFSLEDTIATWFEETRLATKKAWKLWDKDIYGPLLFVNIENRHAYSNYPDTANVLKKKGQIYAGILPQHVLLANASIPWGGRVWAMILIKPPKVLYPEKFDRINLLSHELFHVAQPFVGFPMQNELRNNHLDEKNGRIYLRLELEALKKAVSAASKKESAGHVRNAILFRKYRHSLFPGSDSSENILDLNEGITEYTGAIIADRDKRSAMIHFTSKIDTFFTNPTYIRTFSYYNIPVYGYLLRDQYKYWNKEIRSNTNLTDYFIRKFQIMLPEDLQKAVDSISGNYNVQNILATEEEREKTIQVKIDAYKKRFLERPILIIPFFKKRVSFDSRYLLALEHYGTVYPTMTAIDNWGILKVDSGGALINPDGNMATISAPSKIGEKEANGDGWVLSLNEGYRIIKDENSGNYRLEKK